MRKEDFKIGIIECKDGHIDYWFYVNGETEKELTNKYREMCMIGVTEVVYSKDEDIVGIKRLFPFNYDVVLSDDESLKELLKSIIYGAYDKILESVIFVSKLSKMAVAICLI